ncbi:phosphatidylinositol N-acetylglucosaminyltransferase subunit C [Orussus abietinus]|uniref:phosphatidylinositol N-acetylglucosaminyltransferase subunit C n=1 Tax=Orussus abietinus TaxID=222816 RepID=UPI0006267597|nr:phosphatidylinositol N-acetylglucosaminyltransferase subunit C [Orussus abietinus]
MSSVPYWRKNLYNDHGLPDNYTHSSFLEELRKNVKPNNVLKNEAITLGAGISIQLSIVVLFIIVFVWLNNEWTTPNIIFTVSAMLTVLAYFLYSLKFPNTLDRISTDFRTVLIFLTFGYIVSPILKTLTETVSTDTIYVMTVSMFLTHLIFSKYGSPPVSLSDSLSITSSLFGSLMLTSRLASPLHAFSLLTIAVLCFVLLPFVLSQIESKKLVALIFAITTWYFLYPISITFSWVFVIATIFLYVICPLWYVKWQTYKENIYGPWDEAVITS